MQPAGPHRSGGCAHHESDQGEAGRARGLSQHQFDVKRHENRQPDDGADPAKSHDHDPADQRLLHHGERDERLRRAQQPQRKQAPYHGRASNERDDLWRSPGVMLAAPGERQQQRERRCHHQPGAGEVEPMRALVARQAAQRPVSHQQRGGAERHVDPEDHRPVHIIGEHAAEHRADDARTHEHDRGIALHDRPLARRQEVRDHRLRERQDAAAAESLAATARGSARPSSAPARRRSSQE